MITCFSVPTVSAKTNNYCIKATPAITKATYEYLNEIYINKFPELALEDSFGSEKDRKVLENLAKTITAKATTPKKKVEAIVNSVYENIEYLSYSSGEAEFFAIDTYYTKKGNCLGIAELIIELCRLSGIKAVLCCGSRGDMRDFVSLDTREIDHAWAMIYHDGDWRLYDPLFSVFGETDQNVISRWYFTDLIEGVSPYVKKYSSYFNYGRTIFYINGRFVHYANGMPASEHFKMGAEGGTGINESLPYFTKNRYNGKHDTGSDGFEYVENPSRKNSMINDECYSNGWITYGESMYYAKPNGILAGCTIKEYNGECYYLPYGSDAIKLSGTSNDYSLTRGLLSLIKGNKINPKPLWVDAEIKDGKVIVWKSETPETLSVSSNGTITALSEGYGCVSVCSKDTVYGDTHYYHSYIEFWVSPKVRTVKHNYDNACDTNCNMCNAKRTTTHSYKTTTTKATLSKNGKIVKKCAVCEKVASTSTIKYAKSFKLSTDSYTYNGKVKTPSVTVKDSAGKTLKKNTDYTVTYASGRKNVGTYKVTVKMIGKYSGTKTLTFKINPAKTTVSKLTAGKKSITVAITKKTAQVTGYQIQCSTSKTFSKATTKTISSYKTTKYTLKSLSAKKTYYVKVRTYKTVGKTKYYSGWSTYKYVKTK